MEKARVYKNFLEDSFRYGYHQIKTIYDKIDKAILEKKYINIRTGYLMKEKDPIDINYYFYKEDPMFPLCYHFDKCCSPDTIDSTERLIYFYIYCLEKFHSEHDEEQIKIIVKNEKESAKKDYYDLKLVNQSLHRGEQPEYEESYNNSSSFINDNNKENENKENENEDEDGNQEQEDQKEEDGSDIKKKRKGKLMKNGKKVFNEYKKELDGLEDNYDGEDELNNQEEEEDDLSLNIKNNSFKKEKLSKKYLNKKVKRNIINDSEEEEENERDRKKGDEKEQNKENEKEEKNSKNDEEPKIITEKIKISIAQENKNALKIEEEDECDLNNNNDNTNKLKTEKKINEKNKKNSKSSKKNKVLRQGNLNAFLQMGHK